MKGKLIDVSIPLRPGMVTWPGDPPFMSDRLKDFTKGDHDMVSIICMGAHTGTHVDAPLHFIKGGISIDKAPADVLTGPARVIEIKDTESIKPGELEKENIQKGERILFKSRNSSLWKDPRFHKDFVYISDKGAEYLAQRGIALAGVDYLSVGGFRGGTEVHQTLLGKGVWLIEGLDLSKVGPGEYELLCLPLKLQGAEAAPARVFLRTL